MYNLRLLPNAANARTADMRRSFNAWITSLTVIRDSGYRGRVQRETLTAGFGGMMAFLRSLDVG